MSAIVFGNYERITMPRKPNNPQIHPKTGENIGSQWFADLYRYCEVRETVVRQYNFKETPVTGQYLFAHGTSFKTALVVCLLCDGSFTGVDVIHIDGDKSNFKRSNLKVIDEAATEYYKRLEGEKFGAIAKQDLSLQHIGLTIDNDSDWLDDAVQAEKQEQTTKRNATTPAHHDTERRAPTTDLEITVTPSPDVLPTI